MLQSHYDKTRVAQHFARAAQSYSLHDSLQRQVAARLMRKLQPTQGILLDVGCGPAHHAPALRRQAGRYVGLDIAAGMLSVAQQSQAGEWLLADMERLPLATGTVACLYSNLAMQWANNPSALMQEWHRVLAANGQLVASTVLAGSMWPLTDCFQRIDGVQRHNQWLSRVDLQSQLNAQPWRATCTEVTLTLEYASLTAMLRDLKGIGANYTARQQPAFLGRHRLQQLEMAMEVYRTSTGMLPMRWQIGLIEARK